jgi:hypothetical protein
MPRNIRQKRRRNIGNKARKRLPLLLKKHNYKCYWCQKDIVMLKSISVTSIVDVDHGSITWQEGNKTVTKYIASVDHKVGLIDGGTNDIDNLVPSCRYCNELRGRDREKAGIDWISRVKIHHDPA